jgi:hypothetical protein
LRKLQVVWVTGGTPTDNARLRRNELPVRRISQPPGLAVLKFGFVDAVRFARAASELCKALHIALVKSLEKFGVGRSLSGF